MALTEKQKQLRAKGYAVGQRFGRRVLIGRAGNRWLCRCDCGAQQLVTEPKAGKSCGCLRREVGRAIGSQSHPKHGATIGRKSPEYNAWTAMHQRCSNPRNPAFKWYGARGIKVCARWASFEAFLVDMGPRPPGLTLERVDNARGYSPSNCKWATWTEQNNNTRRNRSSAC